MKKLLLAILVSATGIGLYSCNNGAYDLDPKDNGGALNPLNPENKVSIPPGNLKATVNGVLYQYYPGYYVDTGGNQKVYYGFASLDNDGLFKRWIGMAIAHTEGKDPDFTNKTIVNAWYSYIDTSTEQRIYFVLSSEAKVDKPGSLKGKDGDAIRGFLPEGDYTFFPISYDHDSNSATPKIKQESKVKTIKITGGEFHLRKTTKLGEIRFLPPLL